jgi:hypothetical protein
MKLPLCAGSGEGSDHLGSLYAAFPCNFCKRLFPRLEPVTSWSQGDSFYLKLGYLNKIKVRKHRMLNQGIHAYKRICLDSNQNITEPATKCNFTRYTLC